MSVKLKEFAINKALMVTERLFKIIGRRLNLQFKIHGEFSVNPYKNKWQKYVGIQAYVKSTDRYYQLNFERTNADKIVSIDIFRKGSLALKGDIPEYTTSLENYSIKEVLSEIEEFIKDPKAFYMWHRQNVQEAKGPDDEAIVRFIADNPSYLSTLQNIGSFQNGSPEAKSILNATLQYRKGNGANIENLTQLRAVVKRVLTSQAPTVSQATGASAQSITQSAKAIPQVKALPGSAGGPQIALDNFEDEWNQVPKGILDLARPTGALGIIYDLKQELQEMYDYPKISSNLLVISGRGGVGKTFTSRTSLKRMGLQEGSDYGVISGTKGARDADGFLRLLAQYAGFVFIIIDDADSQMTNPSMANVLKVACQYDDQGNRKLELTVNDAELTKAKKQGDSDIYSVKVMKTIPFDAKIIWITNNDPESLWKSAGWQNADIKALMTRSYREIPFNFTNEEVLDIIKSQLMSISLAGGAELDEDARLAVFLAFKSVVERRSSKQKGNCESMWKGISFREFKEALDIYWKVVIDRGHSVAQFGITLQKTTLPDLRPSDLQIALTTPAAAL